MPSTPYDAKGLMISSIRDDNPVLFVENKMLYRAKGEVPEESYAIPIGKADVKRTGKDITIVATSHMVGTALKAAAELEKEGVDAEIIDPRTISPLEKGAILESVKKTGRLLVVHEAVRNFGFGAEVAAIVSEEGFDFLDAPIMRIGAPFMPVPFSKPAEDRYIPSVGEIVSGVKRTLNI